MKTYLTHESLSVFRTSISEVIVDSDLIFRTPGMQELFDVTHPVT